MKYLIDTANLEMIKKCNDLLPIAGVTSNPSIIKKEGKIDFFAHLNKIRQIIGIDKTLHVQILVNGNIKVSQKAGSWQRKSEPLTIKSRTIEM